MSEPLFGIPNMDIYIILVILVFFIIIEVIAGYLHSTRRNFGDWFLEAGSYFILGFVIKPGIILVALALCNTIIPNANYLLVNINFGVALLIFLLIDDFLQYWYHRSAHEYAFLWKLHRPHHQAEEMGFFVSYRNGALYYLMMPNIWWLGIFTFLGGLKAMALGLVLKQLVIISSHSTVPYDRWLHKSKFLSPLASVLERIFITPAFHHTHHGKSKIDEASDPNNNFGNMFSIWDQLFGTAVFTRKYPSSYGLENDPQEHWSAVYLYPAIASSDPKSELSRGFKKKKTALNEPSLVKLSKGDKVLWCQCGMSKNQPFCDGTHHGTKFKPLLFEATKDGPIRLCNCKKTGHGPFCDGSHKF